ncbi:MAG: ADP-forming succinate--CoA ligase subunit beta [Bacillati bacterium ANGP1]|uniref:Succinate--CoA ligase [ADP-forming] subunit beta n=1 Tax=Candidatus Segetimicrobium genomatis TaxID=2569760 RepID=A0A537JPA7_9BACT|nr:MAG: ADP-forming succinate--CoA ligase subunit beta [Terrabacteria group bacterium ANGP1]
MKLHEFQAKEVFARYGLPVQQGVVIERPGQMAGLTLRYPVVVKAQVLVGGRGKAGGIKLAATPAEAESCARAILGMTIKGERVERVLVVPAAEISAEYYLAVVTDRAQRRAVAVASAAGGVEIETVARTAPEKIVTGPIDPCLGCPPFQARAIGRRLGFAGPLLDEFAGIAGKLYRLYWAEDADLAEINPLAVVGSTLLCVDAKLVLDDNAAFRHADRPPSEELTALELEARSHGLSYVELAGDIAVIGNGAGLVMSTLDLLAHFGGRAANFLDVGGGATADGMRAALDIVQRKSGIRSIFINIFGGITRCDEVARGIVQKPPRVPASIRLTGTNEEEGQRILRAAGIAATLDPDQAAQEAVALARAAPRP